MALQLEADLAPALERQEFHVFYQPIVSLESSKVVGFEALVRWQHPVLGMIPPVEFITIAERTGLIVALGQWYARSLPPAESLARQSVGKGPLDLRQRLQRAAPTGVRGGNR